MFEAQKPNGETPIPGPAATYPVPPDQPAFEAALQETFAQQFPDSDLLGEALDTLQRAMEDSVRGPSTMLRLKTPVERDDEEIMRLNSLSSREKSEIINTDSGLMIAGPTPPETETMLEDLYQLTGATIQSDSRSHEHPRGLVLRHGIYRGQRLYFFEQHNFDRAIRKNTLRISILSQAKAEGVLGGLRSAGKSVKAGRLLDGNFGARNTAAAE